MKITAKGAASSRLIKSLRRIANRFDSESNNQKLDILSRIARAGLPSPRALIEYTDVLLFLCAFPPDKSSLKAAEQEIKRIASVLKKRGFEKNRDLTNSGLPFSPCISSFTYDYVEWLLTHPDCSVRLQRYEGGSASLNDVLALTLPTLERSETTAGLSNEELLKTLGVSTRDTLSFLIDQLRSISHDPYIRDHFYDSLGIYVELSPRNPRLSRVYNRIPTRQVFFHDTLLKRFDHRQLLDSAVMPAVELSERQKKELVLVVKNAMALTDRETDPTTYLDPHSLRLYPLDRGLSIAIYGMPCNRQMPLESYVGYTLFKNGFPAAYGGGWVFGQRADFGINIFEPYRGGESGYMMCQVLRLYRQVFNVSYFEIEPYQFGLDNPDGISSGAFWFYYRYGFRPVDKKLMRTANRESKKISRTPTYRAPEKVLLEFTKSNMALKLGEEVPTGVYDITTKVSKMIRTVYHGDRIIAEQDCVKKFSNRTGTGSSQALDNPVFKEASLWAAALHVTEPRKTNLLLQMVQEKPIDLFRYQALLLSFFDKA